MEVPGGIREFITSNFYVANPAALGDEDSLLDSGIIDSTGVLEVVTFLEEQYNIQVKDEEMLPENLDSIGKITRYVERKRSG